MKESIIQLCLRMSLVLAFVAGPVMAEDQNTDTLSISELESGVKELSKGDYQDAKKLKSLYKELENNVESELEKQIKREVSRKSKGNIRYRGQLHNLLIIATNWQMSGTVDELAKGIKLRFDQSDLDAGERRPPEFFYPVARTLAEIGDYHVMLKIFDVIRTGKPREREIAVWVLYEAFGSDFAKAMIKSAADQERNSKLQDRLRDAVKLLDKEGKLLSTQR